MAVAVNIPNSVLEGGERKLYSSFFKKGNNVPGLHSKQQVFTLNVRRNVMRKVVMSTMLMITLGFFIGLSNAQQSDTLDVEPGYETLNLAIEADNKAPGGPVPNRVYRLKRGEFYLLNGTIRIDAGTGRD